MCRVFFKFPLKAGSIPWSSMGGEAKMFIKKPRTLLHDRIKVIFFIKCIHRKPHFTTTHGHPQTPQKEKSSGLLNKLCLGNFQRKMSSGQILKLTPPQERRKMHSLLLGRRQVVKVEIISQGCLDIPSGMSSFMETTGSFSIG